MSPNVMDIYGSYADGYCEELAPSGLPLFYHAAGSVNFSRLPGYPTFTLVFVQATERSAGNDTVSYLPLAQEMYIKLDWPHMPKTDKENLEAFWSIVNGMGQQFTYNNHVTAPSLPVHFAQPSLPVMPEVAFQQYQVSLSLRVALNYPRHTAGGVPPELPGNRFVFGGVAMQFPVPLKGGSGRGLVRQQPTGRDSSGDMVVYDKSRIVQVQHRLLMRFDYDGFVKLQSFFFSFVHGARNVFTWIDADGVSRPVRLSGTTIEVRQLGYDRFETELELIEESPI